MEYLSWPLFQPTWPPTRDQFLGFVGLYSLYLLVRTIYRAFFDPLSAYPGPKLWAVSDIPRTFHMLKGDISYRLNELHEKYGPVVRIGRHFLSYATPDAWNDIYAKVRPEIGKDPKSCPPPPSGVWGLALHPSDADHSRMRRNLAQGVTEKALRDQEPILRKYFDTFIQKLKHSYDKGPVDLSMFFNLTAVDIIGDLTYGESFGCLESSSLHFWVKGMFDYIKVYILLGVCMQFPPLDTILLWAGRTFNPKMEKDHRGFAGARLAKRLEMKDPRPDLIAQAQVNLNTSDGMSFEELEDTCVQITLAGSETTATLLTGVVYYLLKNPLVLERLVKEIRSTFPTEDAINMVSVRSLKYGLAVLEEGLRIFPPVPNQVPRMTNPEGNIICGRFVPGRTSVSVSHYSCYHSADNFRDPYKFAPERWLSDERYKDDRKGALQPFSVGPRNCLGISLARMEMRIILARLLWNFDLELCEESKDWIEGMKIFMIWQRPQLLVKLTPVKRG